MNIKSILLVLFSMLILMSCKKESDKSGDTFPEKIQGVWQEEGWDDGDELGMYFTSKEIGFWDYMGDEYDEGDDCYYADIVGELISYEGDDYRIKISEEWADEGESNEGTVRLVVEGDMLTLTEPDDDEDYEEVYSKDSRSVSGLTPKCETQAKASEKQDVKKKLFNN